MPRENEEPLIEQLVHNLIKKTDAHYDILTNKVDSVNDRMDSKVDNLADRMCGEFQLLRKDVSDKIGDLAKDIEKVDLRTQDHNIRLTKIEQNWTIFTVAATAVAGGLATILSWIGHMLGIK